jgi:hypothetical protein
VTTALVGSAISIVAAPSSRMNLVGKENSRVLKHFAEAVLQLLEFSSVLK